MNQLALHAQNYLLDQVSPMFPALPTLGDLSCEHIPAAIMGNQSVRVIEDAINSCQGAIKKVYQKAMGLTLHHLSAIAERSDLLQILCKQIMSLPKDKGGFTPLHFRAILTKEQTYVDDPYYKAFKENCQVKKLSVKNHLRQTPENIHAQIFDKESGAGVDLSNFNDYNPIDNPLKFSTTDVINTFYPISNSTEVQATCFGNFRYVNNNVISRKAVVDMEALFQKKQQSKKFACCL